MRNMTFLTTYAVGEVITAKRAFSDCFLAACPADEHRDIFSKTYANFLTAYAAADVD